MGLVGYKIMLNFNHLHPCFLKFSYEELCSSKCICWLIVVNVYRYSQMFTVGC